MNDTLGDRMKEYEERESARVLFTALPILCRIDGRCFSNFTKGLSRPFDARLSQLMVNVTTALVKEFSANCGYTQSDEITLTWLADNTTQQTLFGGRVSKLTSVLASAATAYFLLGLAGAGLADYNARVPQFDGRVWNVPTLEEGANCFLWRELDATKNAISMAASCYYSHQDLMNKTGAEKQEMLFKKGVNFNDYPAFFKRGTFIQKTKVLRQFTTEEINKLPLKHNARKNPQLLVERTDYVKLGMPPFSKVTNRADVIYKGERPLISRETWEECKKNDS